MGVLDFAPAVHFLLAQIVHLDTFELYGCYF